MGRNTRYGENPNHLFMLEAQGRHGAQGPERRDREVARCPDRSSPESQSRSSLFLKQENLIENKVPFTANTMEYFGINLHKHIGLLQEKRASLAKAVPGAPQ